MMNKTLHGVRCLISRELTMARRQNGYYFASPHEGYGVIMEELDEAREVDCHAKRAAEELLYAIRRGNSRRVNGLLREMERQATLAACEYIQVAAMARKMIESGQEVEPGDREG